MISEHHREDGYQQGNVASDEKQEQSAKQVLFHKRFDKTEVKLNIITTHIFSHKEGSVWRRCTAEFEAW